MVLEEYDPVLFYIKEPDNVVADALSHLDLLPDAVSPTHKENNKRTPGFLKHLSDSRITTPR